MLAAIADDRAAMTEAAVAIGYFDAATQLRHQNAVLDMFEMALEPLTTTQTAQPFDFADNDMAARLREAGMALGLDKDFWHIPPIDTLFLHRKLGGLYLLAARLKARVNVHQLAMPYLKTTKLDK